MYAMKYYFLLLLSVFMLFPGFLADIVTPAGLTGILFAQETSSAGGSSAAGQNAAEALPSLDQIIPGLKGSDRKILLDSGKLVLFYKNGETSRFVPETDVARVTAEHAQAIKMGMRIESLFLFRNSELPDKYSTLSPEKRNLALYNILRSVSTLQGIEYYSASRDKMRILFEESWAVKKPDLSKASDPDNKIRDPLVTVIPPKDTIYIYQKDKTFGKNVSSMTFIADSQSFASSIVNLYPMKYKGFFKVIDAKQMRTDFVVIPVKEGLLIYGTMGAKTKPVKAFLDKAESSFRNRVIALADWYKDRISQEFR